MASAPSNSTRPPRRVPHTKLGGLCLSDPRVLLCGVGSREERVEGSTGALSPALGVALGEGRGVRGDTVIPPPLMSRTQ